MALKKTNLFDKAVIVSLLQNAKKSLAQVIELVEI
jgi:hypothetical protein